MKNKRNGNKGFTLIELLASIVLLGILFVFAIPTIVGVVEKNRDKIYVSDARKLMSQAEYKLKSSSTIIEKPEPGDCIVISLVYLDSEDFDQAPNDGEYIKDASFVVVKNNDGTLEYSAAIVEKTKAGGYRGIELTKEALLKQSNAVRFVKNISENKIIKVEDPHVIMSNYINQTLKSQNDGKDYVTTVSNIYNKPNLEDQSSSGETLPPVITKATLTSTSGKNYNSLDATLNLTVTDRDNPTNQLVVGLSTSSYTDALNSEKIPYGEENTFTKTYEFDKMGYGYIGNNQVNLYIVVIDPEKNRVQTTINYKLHKNEPPVIGNGSQLVRRAEDSVNKGTAMLKLDLSDDIDSTNALRVCYTANVNAESCNNYVSYRDMVRDDVYIEFDTTQCNLRGQEYQLKVFAADSSDAISAKVLTYKVHNDGNPAFDQNKKQVDVVTAETGYNSLNVKVFVNGSDDVTPNSNLRVRIVEGNTDQIYRYDANGIPFKLSGRYDGEKRTLKVTLIDECNHQSNTVTYSEYTVYKNVPPQIDNISIMSNGYACNNSEECPIVTDNGVVTSGGNAKTSVYINILDDLDSDDLYNNIKVCVSENRSNCNNEANFKLYSEYANGTIFTFDAGNNTPYNGSTKTLYVVSKDSEGAISESSKRYTLYKNKAPEITGFDVHSEDRPFVSTDNNSLNLTFFLQADDDILDLNDLEYTIQTEGSNEVVEKKSLAEYDETRGLKYHVAGTYDGGERTIVLKVYDNYSAGSEPSTQKYKVYKNKPPEISLLKTEEDPTTGEEVQVSVENEIDIIQSSECLSSYKCPYLDENANGQGQKVSVIFEATDDIDGVAGIEEDDGLEQGEMTVCVSETEADCTAANSTHYIPYKQFVEEEREYIFNKGMQNPYNSQNKRKTLYVYLRDSGGLTTHVSKPYTLYTASAPRFIDSEGGEGDQPVINYPNITPTEIDQIDEFSGIVVNGRTALYNMLVVDDFEDSINLETSICYKKSSDSGQCNNWSEYKPYEDTVEININDSNIYDGTEYEIYARVRNSLGLVATTSTPLKYTIYEDQVPRILSVAASYETATHVDTDPPASNNGSLLGSWETYNSSTMFRISIIAEDFFDSYKICVGKDPNGADCTDDKYLGKQDGTLYSGTNVDSILFYYNEPDGLKSHTDSDIGFEVLVDDYYLFVKDSHGKIAKSDAFFVSEFNACDEQKPRPSSITYEHLSGSTISTSACRGQCYYSEVATDTSECKMPGEVIPEGAEEKEDCDLSDFIEVTSGIVGNYKKKLTYNDVFTNATCQPKEETYEANCSFKQCFYNKSTQPYNVKAIGLRKNTFPRGGYEMVNIIKNGQTEAIKSYEYYIVYTVTYDGVSESVDLHPTPEYVFPEEYNSNPDKYKYNASDDVPYIRVMD